MAKKTATKNAKKKGNSGKIAAGVLALALIGGAIGGDEPANNVVDDDVSISVSDVADQNEADIFDTVDSVDSSATNDDASSDAAEGTDKKEEVQDTKTEEPAKEEPVKKEEPKDTSKVEQTAPPDQTPPPAQQSAEEKKPESAIDPEAAFREKLLQYNYVCSTERDKYHYPTCHHTSKINDSNLAHFDTEEEAIAAGYVPCGTCKP